MKTLNKLYLNILLIAGLLIMTSTIQAQFTVSGTITTELGDPIQNVIVGLSGDVNQNVLTDENGYYEFTIAEGSGTNYILTPYSNSQYLNGVTLFDMVKIKQHISNDILLDSPYKIIAADINHSNAVDWADTTDMRNLILFITDEFPNNTSWRFVESEFIFPNPLDPFETAFPEVVSINDLQGDLTGVDFIGIKIGDVNNTAVPFLVVDPCDVSCGHISGSIYYDDNENCTYDTGELGLQNWMITATSNQFTFNVITNELGEYSIDAFAGDYTVTVTPPNGLWSACQLSQNVNLAELEEESVDFLMQAVGQCAAMEVDMGTPFLRRCFDSFYAVQYCNQGTEIATDAYVEVTFDSFLTITNTSIPWATQNGNTYTFDLGDVGVNECGVIDVELEISCDAVLGETFCSEAHIYPDSLCVPPSNLWDGASLELLAHCEGDSVRFEIINVGDPMTQSVNYIVIEDDMIMMTGDNNPILLASQESWFLSLPANGSTWRLELDQSPNHPLNEMLSAAIEGCGLNGSGSFSMGFITLFPQFTESASVDIDCVVGIGSFDPNDKHAIPEGVHEEHFIERNTDIEYRIRFQNTGTDTAFTVVVKDTLSPWLDVSTIRPGASSHDYSLQIFEENILEFRFENIMLPDSNVNEVASHGFLKFKISQTFDNPLGTVIENDAAIYFDFNEPVITNTVFHTIGENFIDIVDNVLIEPTEQFNIKLYPNLIGHSATLKLEGMSLQDGSFLLYDLYGRLLSSQQFSGDSFEFSKNQLTSGMYLFEIMEHGQRLSTGKLMIR